MKKAISVIIGMIVLAASMFMLAACNKELGKLPDVEIKSEHNYVDGVCVDCGYEADLWDGSISLGFEQGSGTSEDPYLIQSAAELAYLQSASQNVSFSRQYFELTTNIDMGGREWKPIESFSGAFYGNGHTISAFTISDDSSNAYNIGFFGSLTSGYLYDLRLDNFYIGVRRSDSSGGGCTIGGLVGNASGSTIRRCAVENSQIAAMIYNKKSLFGSRVDLCVGGLVGSGVDEISDCYADVTMTVEGVESVALEVGGIAGVFNDKIDNSYFIGSMTVKSAEASASWVGGIAGYRPGAYFKHGVVSNCFVELTGDFDDMIGAILDEFSDAEDIVDCFVVDTSSPKLNGSIMRQADYNDVQFVKFYSKIGTMSALSAVWDESVWNFEGEYPQLRVFENQP